MEEDGTVSFWVGQAETRMAFEAAIEAEFSEDGGFVGSEFSRAFGIAYYDDSTREAHFHDSPPTTLPGFIEGASYGDIVIPRFLAKGVLLEPGDNCLVLLYNYHHVAPVSACLAGVRLTFKGSISYLKHSGSGAMF